MTTLNDYARQAHADNRQWWIDLTTGRPLKRHPGELIALVASEITGEALEGLRKGLNDDKLTHRPMVEVELADGAIRLFDYAGGRGLDLDVAYAELLYRARYRGEAPDGDLTHYVNQARALRLADYGFTPRRPDLHEVNAADRLFDIVAELTSLRIFARFERGADVEAMGCVAALVAIFDFAGEFKLDLDGAYREKREFNLRRADHKPEARRAVGGKKF